MAKQQAVSEDVNAQIERELQAQIERELEAEMNRKRVEIAARLRHEAEMRNYDRINARHPIEGPGDPVFEAKRRADMDARAKADFESMDRANSRPVEGDLVHQRSRADSAGGSAGFRFKRAGA
jgi:hypothetical protein